MLKGLCKLIHTLLDELNILWNSSEDERYKGEHPGCDRLHEEIEEEFRKISEEELKGILDNLPEEQVEQLVFVLESMADEYPFMEDYL